MQRRKSCIHCGEKVIGRSDKKFCGMDCRSNHNNQINRDKNNLMRNVNRILRINRNILMKLNASSEALHHMDRLKALGFNFSYCTNMVQTVDDIVPFCYEFGLQARSDNYYAIVEKEEILNRTSTIQKKSAKIFSMRSHVAMMVD